MQAGVDHDHIRTTHWPVAPFGLPGVANTLKRQVNFFSTRYRFDDI